MVWIWAKCAIANSLSGAALVPVQIRFARSATTKKKQQAKKKLFRVDITLFCESLTRCGHESTSKEKIIKTKTWAMLASIQSVGRDLLTWVI